MKELAKIIDLNSPNTGSNLHLQEFPLYPVVEDIYNQAKRTDDVDLDKISGQKEIIHTKLIGMHSSTNGLDVPGAELDDAQENIGSEDEENNYYSLGGDEHNDLDEDRVF